MHQEGWPRVLQGTPQRNGSRAGPSRLALASNAADLENTGRAANAARTPQVQLGIIKCKSVKHDDVVWLQIWWMARVVITPTIGLGLLLRLAPCSLPLLMQIASSLVACVMQLLCNL